MSWQSTIVCIAFAVAAVVAGALHMDHLAGVLAGAAAGLAVGQGGGPGAPRVPLQKALGAAKRAAPLVGAITGVALVALLRGVP